MFRSTHNKGFAITFANGNTVSVQWGPSNYCEARGMDYEAPMREPSWDSATAEVAAWDSETKWHNFGGDQVRGWMTPDEVLEFLSWAASNELDISDPFAWSDDDEEEESVMEGGA